MFIRGGSWGRENWMKGAKEYKLLIIRQVSTRGVKYGMINIINNAVYYESC